MVAISAVRASNAGIRAAFGSSPTAVFVGGTEGIGFAALSGFVANTDSPNIYIIGRSAKKGEDTIARLKKVNDKAKYEFVAGDFTLLQDVDRVANIIIQKAEKTGIQFACLSPGFLSLGRHGTKEGLDQLLVIRYYARLLFIHRLLSSLPEAKRPKRILAVLAGGTEDTVNESDLALSDPVNYGKILPCAAHSSTFTSLSFEHLATLYPTTAFVHEYPGLVKTQSLTGWIGNEWVRWLVDWTLVPLVTPFCVPLEEAGQRALFYLTSKRYPPQQDNREALGVELPENLDKAGTQGKGGKYAVLRYGDLGDGKCMAEYRERDFGKTVWEHSLKTFEDALKKSI